MKFALILKNQKAFTLIELLIVIGILSILATITLLVINPIQLVKQSRDGNRLAEINQINKALLVYQSFGGSSLGTHETVYVSIPSDQADCSDLGLPALGGGYVYACANSTNYRKIDGTGWIPVDFTSVQSQAGTLFSNLPIDPINTVASDFYYTYIPGSWALSATMESDKYIAANAANDGGQSDTRFEVGNELALNVNLESQEVVYALRDTGPGGGFVFYITDGGIHGMEAAPLSTEATGYPWGFSGTDIAGSAGTAVGTGAQNTIDFMTAGGPAGTASWLCDGLSSGGQTDWFLPSRDELALMYTNLQAEGAGSFTNTNYWSSSEYGTGGSWYINFTNGSQTSYYKYNGYYVRCARSF